MMDLPEAFLRGMAERLGAEYEAFLRSYAEPACRGLRLNPLKRAEAAALPPRGVAVPWEQDAYYVPPDTDAGARPLHEAGAYYMQEPSAMLPAAVLAPVPGERVLDLCAAPGGKTTQLGARLAGQGLLVANEPVMKRCQILSRNVERMGITNALVVCALPDQLAARWPAGFDAVQVDAPCSGEGMFRRHPETRAEWTADAPAGCAKRQGEILDSAAALTRPGGRLVYSTCTLNQVENEGVVDAFCARHPDFAPVPFHLPGANAPDGLLTCFPHRMRGEGQFVALLRRRGEGEARLDADRSLPRPERSALAALSAFAACAAEDVILLGCAMTALHGLPNVQGLKVLRAGVQLGMMKGRVFQPDHAWAVSAVPPSLPRVPLTEAEARRYQAGEVLPAPGLKGFVLPTLAGLPLGWGKVSDGMMKNHYPKGLRRG